jgi:hypothetical protein
LYEPQRALLTNQKKKEQTSKPPNQTKKEQKPKPKEKTFFLEDENLNVSWPEGQRNLMS